MAKTNTTEESVRSSVNSIYSALLDKRRIQEEEREEKKREKKEKEREEKEKKNTKEDGTKKTKKEKREEAIDNFKEVVIGLTGDDLEYSDQKKERKKYRKWIDDSPSNTVGIAKPKKKKKKNYQKEFDPELNMLKALVADQNRFTQDLQKRFQNAVGPATKDAMPLNKTMVELASAIITSRSNSLGLLKEIGTVKKTIADLYMRQKKLDSELGNGNNTSDNGDIGLMGSNIAATLFGDLSGPSQQSGSYQQPQSNVDINVSSGLDGYNPNGYKQVVGNAVATPYDPSTDTGNIIQAQAFDPASWDGPDLGNDNMTHYENIPHKVVVEWHKDEGQARFKAIRNDTGEELPNCPVPESSISSLVFNEKDKVVKGQFDEIYPLEIITKEQPVDQSSSDETPIEGIEINV